jgi:hypothetical protein
MWAILCRSDPQSSTTQFAGGFPPARFIEFARPASNRTDTDDLLPSLQASIFAFLEARWQDIDSAFDRKREGRKFLDMLKLIPFLPIKPPDASLGDLSSPPASGAVFDLNRHRVRG